MNNDNFNWEAWPDKGCDTVSYRAIFNIKGNTHGDIYLIVNFIQPNDENAIIGSWSFAPYKLIDGEQKPEGKVTKRLRDWFKEKRILTFQFMVHGAILIRHMTIGIVQVQFIVIIVPVSEMKNPGEIIVNGII
ncbi:hypothetical protein ACP3P6_02760 [Enterobacter mori]